MSASSCCQAGVWRGVVAEGFQALSRIGVRAKASRMGVWSPRIGVCM
eukprot:CAMPEP_0196592916 /NCGR_PEP_ID=MMETSP1081-20130531/74197_1 /TAXON_ID=36882 /ORGANISM="Pyramimonas amylifera, Strain CCMP720" /LENGTH=46 /DNA_ID= /DNA_START= /DNA_END= /DNA_ORIENTATION=